MKETSFINLLECCLDNNIGSNWSYSQNFVANNGNGDPIYATPDVQDNPLDFRTFYYAPQKYFAGVFYDTFWFNVIIIWIMVFFGIIALYLDLLRKFLKLFERIGDYKLRKEIKKAENPVGK